MTATLVSLFSTIVFTHITTHKQLLRVCAQMIRNTKHQNCLRYVKSNTSFSKRLFDESIATTVCTLTNYNICILYTTNAWPNKYVCMYSHAPCATSWAIPPCTAPPCTHAATHAQWNCSTNFKLMLYSSLPGMCPVNEYQWPVTVKSRCACEAASWKWSVVPRSVPMSE